MSVKVKILKDRAEEGRMLYRSGSIDMKKAKIIIMPYLNVVNDKAKELAKKYHMRPRKVNFHSFVR